MRQFFSVLVFLLPLTLHADQAYQTKNIVGDWFTLDETIFKYYGLRITQEDSAIKLQYCDLSKLQHAEECQKAFKYVGTLTYSESNDSFTVDEEVGSPTPNYLVKVDDKNPNKFLRNWGTARITYRRLH